MMKVLFFCAVFLVISTASADCGSKPDTLFSCKTKNGKRIELCIDQQNVRYTYGYPKKPPELSLSVPKEKISVEESGHRWREYAVAVSNGKTIYKVYSAYDTHSSKLSHEAGVQVTLPNGSVTTVYCAQGNVANNLQEFYLKSPR
jgi:hypothetical protein